MTTGRSTGRKLATGLGVSLLFFCVVEFLAAGLGLAPPVPEPIQVWALRREVEMRTSAGEFRFRADWLWEPRPGALVVGDAINAGGYRGPYYPPEDKAAFRIAVLGDSTSYGFMLPEPEGWTRRLEQELREAGHAVEVLNFGCSGYTIAQGLALYRGRVRDYEPDVVVAAFGACNEHFPSFTGLDDEAKIALLSSTSQRVLSFLRRFDSFRWLESLRGGNSYDAFDPDESDPVLRVAPKDFERLLADLQREVEADGTRLAVVAPPRRQDWEASTPLLSAFDRSIRTVTGAGGLPLADVWSEFRRVEQDLFGGAQDPTAAAAESPLFMDNWHPSTDGHLRYAQVVARCLESAGLLP